MPYNMNPHLPKVRQEAARLVKVEHWSIRKVARHLGVHPSTIMRWCRKDVSAGRYEIPTRSSRPKHSPNALSKETVRAIIEKRSGRQRCGQVIHEELKRDGVDVSLSSVQRTLDRCHLLKKRSPWKRPHDATPRPAPRAPGALLQADTVHIVLPDGSRLYVYTLIDLFSRWAYAEAVEKISAEASARFIATAQKASTFRFLMVQTDHGPEFSTRFTHRLWETGVQHRHSRVRQCNDNAHIERFNRTLQEECLDHTAHTLTHFKKALKEYLPYYVEERLHMGLNFKTPKEMLEVLPRC